MTGGGEPGDGATGAQAGTEAAMVLTELEVLLAELDESDRIRADMARLLDGVANALKGPPPELARWSWHDLPEKAEALQARVAELEATLPDILAMQDGSLVRDLRRRVAELEKAREPRRGVPVACQWCRGDCPTPLECLRSLVDQRDARVAELEAALADSTDKATAWDACIKARAEERERCSLQAHRMLKGLLLDATAMSQRQAEDAASGFAVAIRALES